MQPGIGDHSMQASPVSRGLKAFRVKLYDALAGSERGTLSARIFKSLLFLLIFANAGLVILSSIDSLQARYGNLFQILTVASVILFSLEYLLRVWTCPEHRSKRYQDATGGRLRFIFSPLMILDLLVLLPFYLSLASPPIDLRMVRLLRVLSFFRITHRLPLLDVMSTVIRRQRATLLFTFMVIAILILCISYFIYWLEHEIQPAAFGSIPAAIWWTMATLTTVGYGDVVPQTAGGKIFGVLVMFAGVAMFAIPTGIFVSSFLQEIKRKDFIATWRLVAQVPSFSHLDAYEIATITDLLRLRTAMPGDVIFRRGEVADAMYFIVAGKVEVGLGDSTLILSGGDFFGELALLYKMPRTATVTALTFVELLRLDGKDMETLLEADARLCLRITRAAVERRSNVT